MYKCTGVCKKTFSDEDYRRFDGLCPYCLVGGAKKLPKRSKVKYKQGGKRWKIKGQLHKTTRTVKPVRVGERTIYKDEAGKLWVKCFNEWWKFPEEVEY